MLHFILYTLQMYSDTSVVKVRENHHISVDSQQIYVRIAILALLDVIVYCIRTCKSRSLIQAKIECTI